LDTNIADQVMTSKIRTTSTITANANNSNNNSKGLFDI